MKKSLNLRIPNELLKVLDDRAIACGITRSAMTRMILHRSLFESETYEPPSLPNWENEAYTNLLRGLFGDPTLTLTKTIKSILITALESIQPQDAEILRLRFGLDGQWYTLAEVGALRGVKREWIRQIEARALRRIRGLPLIKELRKLVKENQPDRLMEV